VKRYAFTVDARGKPIAYQWGGHYGGLRWYRVGYAEAKMAIAQGHAEQIPYTAPPSRARKDPRRLRSKRFGSVRRDPSEGGHLAHAFVRELHAHAHVQGRQLDANVIESSSPGERPDTLYVTFVNLPAGIGNAGGGAERMNNRMMFKVNGFGMPAGKVRVELMSSSLPRTHRLRARTGAPDAIAKYLGAFLTQVTREVEPKFTHTSRPDPSRHRHSLPRRKYLRRSR